MKLTNAQGKYVWRELFWTGVVIFQVDRRKEFIEDVIYQVRGLFNDQTLIFRKSNCCGSISYGNVDKAYSVNKTGITIASYRYGNVKTEDVSDENFMSFLYDPNTWFGSRVRTSINGRILQKHPPIQVTLSEYLFYAKTCSTIWDEKFPGSIETMKEEEVFDKIPIRASEVFTQFSNLLGGKNALPEDVARDLDRKLK